MTREGIRQVAGEYMCQKLRENSVNNNYICLIDCETKVTAMPNESQSGGLNQMM